jgi:hypothetical protein
LRQSIRFGQDGIASLSPPVSVVGLALHPSHVCTGDSSDVSIPSLASHDPGPGLDPSGQYTAQLTSQDPVLSTEQEMEL